MHQHSRVDKLLPSDRKCNGHVCLRCRFPRYPFASRSPATFKSINARTFFTHMFDSLCHPPEGCKLKNTWLLCYALGFGVVESQLHALLSDSTTCTEMWHTTANCLRPPAPHASAVSLNLTLAVCTQDDTYWMEGKQKQKDIYNIYKLLICHIFLVILKTEDSNFRFHDEWNIRFTDLCHKLKFLLIWFDQTWFLNLATFPELDLFRMEMCLAENQIPS